MKIVFVTSTLTNSHYKNRIMEFIERGYEVKVYGFVRKGRDNIVLPYDYTLLGSVENNGYYKRILKYIRAAKTVTKENKGNDVVFYLCGLDLAMAFRFVKPKIQYLYEECDLVHTYLGWAKKVLEQIDLRIISKSILTILTSEGFVKYHFNCNRPDNVIVVENKLNKDILQLPLNVKRISDAGKLSIGFVGGPRFKSVYNFIDVFCRHFPTYTFHIFGGPVSEEFMKLKKYPNCFIHGFFKNPEDLPGIYGNIDVLLSTYDSGYDNVRYAEPNKLYESIYFETPVIVSSDTFLAERVREIGIGFDINAMAEKEIVDLVNSLDYDILEEKRRNCRNFGKLNAININDHLFQKVSEVIKC